MPMYLRETIAVPLFVLLGLLSLVSSGIAWRQRAASEMFLLIPVFLFVDGLFLEVTAGLVLTIAQH